MAKKRIYVPVDEDTMELIKAIAENIDRSEAWVSSKLIYHGISFNMLTSCSLDPNSDVLANFKQNI